MSTKRGRPDVVEGGRGEEQYVVFTRHSGFRENSDCRGDGPTEFVLTPTYHRKIDSEVESGGIECTTVFSILVESRVWVLRFTLMGRNMLVNILGRVMTVPWLMTV